MMNNEAILTANAYLNEIRYEADAILGKRNELSDLCDSTKDHMAIVHAGRVSDELVRGLKDRFNEIEKKYNQMMQGDDVVGASTHRLKAIEQEYIQICTIGGAGVTLVPRYSQQELDYLP